MRKKIVLTLVLSLVFSGTALLAHGHHRHDDDLKALVAQLMDSALISLDEAVDIALDAHPGHAVGAELEGEYVDGKLVATYEVEIAGPDGAIHEIILDSRDGRMLKEVTEYEDEDEAELHEFRIVLNEAAINMGLCIEMAEAEGKGRAIEAELEMDDGIPVCEVLTFTGEKLYEIELDMRDGDLIEIELEEFDEDDDDDEHDHGHHHDHN